MDGWIAFSFINILLCIGIDIIAILQYRCSHRLFFLGLLIPTTYLLGVYILFLCDINNPMIYQVPIRIAITLLLLSIFLLLGSERIAYKIRRGK